MNIETIKLKLIQLLLDTEDESVLKQIEEIFLNEKTDWFEELSEEEQNNIDASIKSLDAGDGIPTDLVQERIAYHIKNKNK